MRPARRWYGIGALASTAALIALVVALVPGAQASAAYKSCGNKKITIQIENGEGGKTPFKVTAKAVEAKNLTCADAFTFIREAYSGENTGKSGYPQNYKCKNGEFKVPVGYIPTICTKGSKAIKYGGQGG